jgi:dTDP-4-dehydrorhamnose reductase
VLHLAAATDVDRCEQEPAWADDNNALGTENVALACQVSGTPLVYVSTGAVFNGSKPEPYVELDEPSPSNIYARSKLAGEQVVAAVLQRYYIVRAGWMFGGAERETKFVGKIARLILGGRRGSKLSTTRSAARPTPTCCSRSAACSRAAATALITSPTSAPAPGTGWRWPSVTASTDRASSSMPYRPTAFRCARRGAARKRCTASSWSCSG